MVYAYSKGVLTNGLKIKAVVRGINEVKAGSKNSISTMVKSRVEWKLGRLGAEVKRSKIISSTYDGHWSKTDWSDFICPLIALAPWVVQWSRPLLLLQPMESSRWDRFKLARLPGETVNLPSVWKLLLSGYCRWLDWTIYNGFLLETKIINYDIITKLLCCIKVPLSKVIIS